MDKPTILITGGNGYIAKSLYDSLKQQYNITTITRQDFDLTTFKATNDFFQGKYFNVVLHTAVQGGSRLKEEKWTDADCNLAMYYNLLQHRSHYGKLIHFGSGAELCKPESPYGLSKRVIANSIREIDNFYNIRIYAVFDENELDTRFIKANLKRYINKEPMLVQDKFMDFFYMKDLVKLVKYHIEESPTKLLKESNCSYINTYNLITIAHMINNLDEHKVPIYIDSAEVVDYTSKFNAPYGLDYIGLQQGILETYKKLKT